VGIENRSLFSAVAIVALDDRRVKGCKSCKPFLVILVDSFIDLAKMPGIVI
jgi:hypothetical protein